MVGVFWTNMQHFINLLGQNLEESDCKVFHSTDDVNLRNVLTGISESVLGVGLITGIILVL